MLILARYDNMCKAEAVKKTCSCSPLVTIVYKLPTKNNVRICQHITCRRGWVVDSSCHVGEFRLPVNIWFSMVRISLSDFLLCIYIYDNSNIDNNCP